jgi:hypothetical protein
MPKLSTVPRIRFPTRERTAEPTSFSSASSDNANATEIKLYASRKSIPYALGTEGTNGQTPIENPESKGAELTLYRWQKHCRGLFETPIAHE